MTSDPPGFAGPEVWLSARRPVGHDTPSTYWLSCKVEGCEWARSGQDFDALIRESNEHHRAEHGRPDDLADRP